MVETLNSENRGEMQWWDCDNVGDDLRLDTTTTIASFVLMKKWSNAVEAWN
eukprot:CAMPEP_0202501070 /NCGR_PEP_ID=MMETSP1361-20130828/34944_1 /ASSEMBLY_ACC=CAM_ASM_000849 /TAXON_ID=210615 /ORGANISM="Staurosira complex sp., Strain CCMP2646" /LENGTH=50 /DNA_ID=CAMNT_0049133703 /DNA_START=105 /DNA_END=257 /DNA_ORIENTATION=+